MDLSLERVFFFFFLAIKVSSPGKVQVWNMWRCSQSGTWSLGWSRGWYCTFLYHSSKICSMAFTAMNCKRCLPSSLPSYLLTMLETMLLYLPFLVTNPSEKTSGLSFYYLPLLLGLFLNKCEVIKTRTVYIRSSHYFRTMGWLSSQFKVNLILFLRLSPVSYFFLNKSN